MLTLVAVPAVLLASPGGTSAAHAAPSGFPKGEFQIVNEATGRCLVYVPGEYEDFGGDRAYNERHNQSGRTKPPTLAVLDGCTGEERQRWYGKDNLLINVDNTHPAGRFALTATEVEAGRNQYGGYYDESSVGLTGAGSTHATEWKFENGYLSVPDNPDIRRRDDLHHR
ncbi:hypothetical protein [Nocardia sp. NPDC047648]|uniref:hypothetical protein n=1 Tax=Nocardia sp. NPDC047648 TaxID=3155625 RepID=UPI0033ECAB81